MLVLCTAVWGRHEGLFELMTSLASRSIWPDVSNEGNVRKPWSLETIKRINLKDSIQKEHLQICSGGFQAGKGLRRQMIVMNGLQCYSKCHSKNYVRIHLPMPVSPSCVSGISARHFWNCRGFDELWIFRVWPAAFKYRMGRKIPNPTIPTTS